MHIISTPQTRSEVRKYPYIGYSYGFVSDRVAMVLFTAQKCGVCLMDSNEPFRVGSYSTNWNEYEFDIYTGTLTITNERSA